jgi:uncharacterized membrane protein YuzA (DUF378 family)
MMDLMRLALILLVVGGLNWGSVGLLGKDLVAAAVGRGAAAKAIYVAVGLAALFVGARLFGFVEGFAAADESADMDCNDPANAEKAQCKAMADMKAAMSDMKAAMPMA